MGCKKLKNPIVILYRQLNETHEYFDNSFLQDNESNVVESIGETISYRLNLTGTQLMNNVWSSFSFNQKEHRYSYRTNQDNCWRKIGN